MRLLCFSNLWGSMKQHVSLNRGSWAGRPNLRLFCWFFSIMSLCPMRHFSWKQSAVCCLAVGLIVVVLMAWVVIDSSCCCLPKTNCLCSPQLQAWKHRSCCASRISTLHSCVHPALNWTCVAHWINDPNGIQENTQLRKNNIDIAKRRQTNTYTCEKPMQYIDVLEGLQGGFV